MYCPRCGAENDEGDRYCHACGAQLRGDRAAPQEKRSPAERLGRLIGTTPRARITTIATAAALVAAVAGFIALKPSKEDSIPQDAYTKSADATCVEEKEQIVAAQRRLLQDKGLNGVSGYADALVPIAGEWRATLEAAPAPPPSYRQQRVATLESALLGVEVEAGALGRIARESSEKAVLAQSARVDEASRQVESAISSLGLERCALLSVDVGKLIKR